MMNFPIIRTLLERGVGPLALMLVCLFSWFGVVKDDFEWVDARHTEFYKHQGFEVQGYQGYNIWSIGRCHWYTLRKGDVTYQSCLLRWGDEVHQYSLQAIDTVNRTSR
jgi:hypothetical protein